MKQSPPIKQTLTYRFVIWVQVLLQIIFPLASILPHNVLAENASSTNIAQSPFSVDRNNSSLPQDTTALPYGNTMSGLASSLSSNGADGIASSAKSAATGYAASSTQQWLSQFGTARVQLNVDDNGNWDDSAIDFLAPLYDNKKSLLFTQLGLRAPDGRTTGNLGMGVRTFYTEDWMFGGNVFFDDDFTGKNRRIGIGAEAWTNNLKLSANTYAGTTEWHSSRDFDDYNEKPADGYDVRAEGYLPAYPQLGAKLMYEQYYGDNVALFDKDHLQSDPSAVTVGLSYTPVPLITATVDYKRGQDSMDETKFGINFRYAIGQSWGEQISPSQVAIQRSLAGSRYDLVERNNEIVLQYKKKDVGNALSDMTLVSVKDNSPADGTATNTVTAQATASDGSPVKNATISWSVTGGAKLGAQSSVTDSNGNASVYVTNTTAEQVIVTAASGSISRSTPSNFTKSVAKLGLKLTKNNSQSDGIDQNAGQVTVQDFDGKVMPGTAITWAVDNGATIVNSDSVTDNNGIATVHFTNSKSGAVKLTASTSGKTESINSNFGAETVSKIDVIMKSNNALSDSSSTNIAQATVTNANGQPMKGIDVSWSVGKGSAKAITPLVVTTDDNGVATLSLTDASAESVTVIAAAGGQTDQTTAIFSAVQTTLTVTMQTDNSDSDGSAKNIAQVLVMKGNSPVSGASVQWSKTSTNAKYASSSSTSTNGSGVATLSLTDLTAETFTVTATVDGQSASTQTTFVAPNFGPIQISLPEAVSTPSGVVVNVAVAAGGTPVQVAAYNGMSAGDVIVVTSNVSGDQQGKTLDYTSSPYTVLTSDVGHSVSLDIPEDKLMDVESTSGTAKLNVVASVTKGQKTLQGKTSIGIDTCSPGQSCDNP